MADSAFTPSQAEQRLLLSSVLIIAVCSLLYELLISSLSSYLLGSSVVHYSLTIGLFLFFMGIGSWFAQFIKSELLSAFIIIEICLGLLGGFCALLLYSAYAWSLNYYIVMLLVIAAISMLVGLELPILTRIVERGRGLRQGLSDVLASDYVGALFAALLFPFILLPYFGHFYTALLTGLTNLLVALLVLWKFRARLGNFPKLCAFALAGMVCLGIAYWFTPAFKQLLNRSLYQDPVVYSQQTQYQQITFTQRGDDLRLYLNGSLQFSSLDEYRYHEPLVHIAASHNPQLENVLIIGGGDGLAAREVLRYNEVESITLVDLDPKMTELSRELAWLKTLNNNALSNPKVEVINRDAWSWLGEQGNLYDLIIVDLPDPDTLEIARLYSVGFYQKLQRRLSVAGVVITQASSPWLARNAFWSVANTMAEVFDAQHQIYSNVPSFGPWGFIMASNYPLQKQRAIAANTRFVNDSNWRDFLQASADLPPLPSAINRLDDLIILQLYREDYAALQQGWR